MLTVCPGPTCYSAPVLCRSPLPGRAPRGTSDDEVDAPSTSRAGKCGGLRRILARLRSSENTVLPPGDTIACDETVSLPGGEPKAARNPVFSGSRKETENGGGTGETSSIVAYYVAGVQLQYSHATWPMAYVADGR
eukprot:5125685-Prymnesium_polylepis.1